MMNGSGESETFSSSFQKQNQEIKMAVKASKKIQKFMGYRQDKEPCKEMNLTREETHPLKNPKISFERAGSP
jgi:hypothetical protein